VKDGLFFTLAFDEKIKKDQQIIKCNFTGEVPDEMVGNKNDILKYISTIIIPFLGNVNVNDITIKLAGPSKKHGVAKDNVIFIEFIEDIVEANLPAIKMFSETGEEICLYLTGDNVRTPSYPVGHGANDALFQAVLLGKVLKKLMTIEEYNFHCKEKLKEADSMLLFFNENKVKATQSVEDLVQSITDESKIDSKTNK
jgi:hypothetical protein